MTSLQIKEVICLIYSAVLFFSGALLIGYAVVLTYKVLFYHFTFIPTDTIGPFLVVFVVGILHLLVTWIGVKGPSKEHDFFIIMFVIITVILLVMEFSVGVWSLVLRSRVEERAVQLMRRSQDKYVLEMSMGKETSEWVRLQSKFECCGIGGAGEYPKIPASCLRCDAPDVVNNTRTCTETYHVGCKVPLVGYVRRLLLHVALLGFLSSVLQIVGIVVFVDFLLRLRQERIARTSRLRQSQRHLQRPPSIAVNTEPQTPTAPQ